MQLVNSILLVVGILFIIPYCLGNCDDDPPCTNDDLYGKGNMCYFAFEHEISPKEMKKNWCADVETFRKGCLHNYTIDFADDFPDILITVVPENGKVVWGYTHLIPVDCYDSKILEGIEWEDGVKVVRSQKMSIEVTLKGEIQNIDCNALVAINQPKKESCIPPVRQPTQSTIDAMVSMYTAAHFPSDYIEEIRNITQRFCKCEEN